MEYVAFGDESGTTGSDRCYGIGLLCVRKDTLHIFNDRVQSLKDKYGIVGELKWSKWSGLLNLATWTEVICSPQNITGASMKKRNFSAEFKRESAQLVLDQNYTVAAAASAMDVGLSTMTRWVKQLRDERQGKIPKASPITPEQIEIRELKKKLQRIEMENDILKNCLWVKPRPESQKLPGKVGRLI